MTIWILLPAFNEEDSLPKLLPKINNTFVRMKRKYRIVVVNDGSNDRTKYMLKEYKKIYPIEIITHKMNRGLGETERDGFEYIASKCNDDDVLIRMDCDDTHEPQYIPHLINKINEGFDVVIASRFQKHGGQIGVSSYRSFISYAANIFMMLLFNIHNIREYSCGYRAYRGSVIKIAISIFGNGFIQLKGLGFTSTLEIIVKLKLLGCKFTEIPFVLRYDQKLSYSKMISSITTFGYFAMAILYHWPFGGWRFFYRDLHKAMTGPSKETLLKYSYTNKYRSLACRLGGG